MPKFSIHKIFMYNCVMYKDWLKGSLRTVILKLLAEHNRMYGYEITRKVEDLTQGQIQITEGALYPSLHKLEADGLLVSERVMIGKRVRKYYKLTTQGQAAATSSVEDYFGFVRTMILLLSPQKPATT